MRIWRIRELLDWLITQFKTYEITRPKQNAEIIISHVLKMKRLDLYLHQESIISETNVKEIFKLTTRREKQEPLQYILGETEFYGYKIKVNPNVLIPRPETELLVEKIIKENEHTRSILEIGTGSGCIAIALAKNLNLERIDAIDISVTALKIAEQNAVLNNTKINFFLSDIFENVTKKFDLIVSNPPYISEEEYENLPDEIKGHEPISALLAENNGLYFYEKILQNAKEHLTESGIIYFEIGHDQAGRIAKIAKENGFKDIQVYKDLNSFDRILKIH